MRAASRYGILCLLLLALPGAPAAQDGGSAAAQAFDRLATDFENGTTVPASAAQASELLEQMRAALPAGDAARHARLQRLVCFWGFDGRPQEGLAFAERELAEAAARADRAASADLLLCRGYHRTSLDDAAGAMQDYEAGLEHARAAGDRRLLADGLSLRGGGYSVSGRQALALQDLLESQRLYEELGLQYWADLNLFAIGTLYRRLGDFAKAEEYFAQAERAAGAKGDVSTRVNVLMQRGFLLEERGELEAARAAYEAGIALAAQHGERYSVAMGRLGMAGTLNRLGLHREALEQLELAQSGFEAIQDRANAGLLQLETGRAWAGIGNHQKALAAYDAAEPRIQGGENLRYLAWLYRDRARSREAVGEIGGALEDTRAWVSAYQELQRNMQSQQSELLRFQFDTARRDAENRRLAAENALRAQEIGSLERVRRWQGLALGLGGVLALVAVYLAVQQVRRARRLHALAMTDELTGVANRRRILFFAEEAVQRAREDGRTLSILTFDIDWFKRINDGYGHAAGDAVLVRVTRACLDGLRQYDMLGRTGGEEFLVVLPRAGIARAAQIAERLRAAVAALQCADIADGLSVSISVGVAELGSADADLRCLMRRADDALYRAKANGRNRVEVDPSASAVAEPAPAAAAAPR